LRAQGRTIAVLGCGIDICYPSEHKELFARIAAAGAVISEFPVGAAPETWRFPRRNRIISGVSRGVIVCDAAEDSGALITATCAAEQNRDVFAVPGNVDSDHNRGTHKLLKEGAKLVEGAEDVLAEYGLDARPGGDGRAAELPPVEVSAEERKILEMLDLEPMPLDTVIENANMPASEVAALLTFLEMKRLVKRVAGPAYVRVLR
jgi:DNA processing protein